MLHKCCNSYLYMQTSLSQKWLTPQSLRCFLPLNIPKHASPGVLLPQPPPTALSHWLPKSWCLSKIWASLIFFFLLGPITCSTSRAVYLLIASFASTHNNQLRHCQRSTHSRPARLVVCGQRQGVRIRQQAPSCRRMNGEAVEKAVCNRSCKA